LSTLLVRGAIRSAGAFLILFTSLAIVTDLIRLTLDLRTMVRLRSVASNRDRIVAALRGPLALGALLFWLYTVLVIFGIDVIFIDAVKVFFAAGFAVGQVEISLGQIIAFIVAIWIAILASRIVRVLLREDVLPRMSLPRGIPNTISTTVHYSIVILGLLVGVGFLGIDLSSLAFIIGALGVGIGFGLQNVVNDFVSGLILIFERPVQVGDTVEVGALTGRITTIGMRTSRIRTYGGSEVIVPNGELVSNQVINWTLSDKERRLEIVVGVAYASDPDQVSAILYEVAKAEEEVMNEPEPIVVFEAFGDSALQFRLYAWIADFDQGLTVRSKLTTAINNALLQAGIEIPFPQRDLHVRSIAPGIVAPPGNAPEAG
jgi:small-conductance mechanosensitive channel